MLPSSGHFYKVLFLNCAVITMIHFLCSPYLKNYITSHFFFLVLLMPNSNHSRTKKIRNALLHFSGLIPRMLYPEWVTLIQLYMSDLHITFFSSVPFLLHLRITYLNFISNFGFWSFPPTFAPFSFLETFIFSFPCVSFCYSLIIDYLSTIVLKKNFPFHSSFCHEGHVLSYFLQKSGTQIFKTGVWTLPKKLRRTKGQIQLQWITTHLTGKNLFPTSIKGKNKNKIENKRI